MRVREIADEKHPFIYEDELATKARAIIRDFALRILPVTDKNKRLLGKISRRDIMAISSSVSAIRVKGIMTKPKYIAVAEDEATLAIKEMLKRSAWFAPVINSAQDEAYKGVLGLEDFIESSLDANHERLLKPVADIMSKEVVTCSPDDEVDNVWRLMQTKSFSALPVVKKDRLAGIISQQDLLERGAMLPTFESDKGRFRASTKISSIMRTGAATVKSSAKIDEAARIMITRNIGRIPVEDQNGRLVGIIDREDIARALVR